MPKYLLLMEQGAGGCDYTIGCGVNYEIFDAENIEEARAKAEGVWCGDMLCQKEPTKVADCDDAPYLKSGDQHLERMIITELIEFCPISEWEQTVSDNQTLAYSKEKEAKENKLLKRLLGKYGMRDAQ